MRWLVVAVRERFRELPLELSQGFGLGLLGRVCPDDILDAILELPRGGWKL